MVEAGLVSRFGEKHPDAKLNDHQVKRIRAARAVGTPRAVLARRFKVSTAVVSHVANRRTWKHI
jgi:hypothetical protein